MINARAPDEADTYTNCARLEVRLGHGEEDINPDNNTPTATKDDEQCAKVTVVEPTPPTPCELHLSVSTNSPVLTNGDPISLEYDVSNKGETQCEVVRIISYWAAPSNSFPPIDWEALGADDMENTSLQPNEWRSPTEVTLERLPNDPNFKYSLAASGTVFGGPPIPV